MGTSFYNHFFGLELLYHIDSINSDPTPACSRARQGWVSVFSELTCIFSHPLPREIKKFAISLGQRFLPPLYGQSCPSAFSAPHTVSAGSTHLLLLLGLCSKHCPFSAQIWTTFYLMTPGDLFYLQVWLVVYDFF